MNYPQKYFQSILLSLLGLLIIHYLNLDLKLQNLFFNQINHSWLIARNDQNIKFILYRLPKYLIVSYGIILIIQLVRKLIKEKLDYSQTKIYSYLIISLVMVPLTVALLKHFSPVHCPDKLGLFHGIGESYISFFEIFKPEIFFNNYGKCSPAGHASGGFALISIHFIINDPLRKKYFFIGAIILGWVMGFYQIAKGAHFLSDTMISMFIGYIVSLTLYKILVDQ